MTPNARSGRVLLLAYAAILVLGGVTAFVLAATVKLLPNDTASLGMSIAELDRFADGRIVDFMTHDRAAMAGTVIAIGVLYAWLAEVPLRNGEPWAWWTLAISGALGFAGFLTYLGYGYFDWVHGLATICLLVLFTLGLARSWSALERPRWPPLVLRSGPSGLDRGRQGLVALGLGLVGAGATIVILGVTGVFVAQDLDFIELSVEQIEGIDPDLVPLIAHDRAEFGGGLVCTGAILLMVAGAGVRSGGRSLWWSLLIALGFLSGGAILGHPAIGYTTFLHVLPAYAMAVMSIVVLALLWRPLNPQRA